MSQNKSYFSNTREQTGLKDHSFQSGNQISTASNSIIRSRNATKVNNRRQLSFNQRKQTSASTNNKQTNKQSAGPSKKRGVGRHNVCITGGAT